MTCADIIQKILEDPDRAKYETISEEPIYKEDGTSELKKCRKISVTVDFIIDYCREKGLPLPDEFLNNN